jgi:DNA-directed RNA polymerase subunit RPC12/RpoP
MENEKVFYCTTCGKKNKLSNHFNVSYNNSIKRIVCPDCQNHCIIFNGISISGNLTNVLSLENILKAYNILPQPEQISPFRIPPQFTSDIYGRCNPYSQRFNCHVTQSDSEQYIGCIINRLNKLENEMEDLKNKK